MSVEAINFIPAGIDLDRLAGLEGAKPAQGDFAAWFEGQLAELNRQVVDSEAGLRQLAAGETNNLHHVMLSLEKAKASFQLTLQIRNKLLEGYQEIMRMQV